MISKSSIKCALIALIMYSCASCERSEADLEHLALHDPNPMRQRDAAERIDNEEILTRIFYETNNIYVKQACVGNFKSRATLKKIAEDIVNSDSARGDAIRRLKDRELSIKIISDKKDPLRAAATECLSPDLDVNLIHELAIDNKEHVGVRSNAIVRMKDQAAIKKILETEKDISIRLTAAQSLKDEKMNEEMFYKEKDKDVKMKIIISQKNEDILKKMISSDSSHVIRSNGIRNIHMDQDYLKNIFHKNSHKHEMLAAIKNISDINFVENQAQSNPDMSVRTTAIERITNREILKEISNTDNNDLVRIAAARRLRRL